MHKVFESFNTKAPLSDLIPPAIAEVIPVKEKQVDMLNFRNLDHFKSVVSHFDRQRKEDLCGMTYKEALEMFIQGKSDFPAQERAQIRNLVRKNLYKRGLITEEVYEAFQYTVDGTNVGVDIGRYLEGQADCVISPAKEYVDFFYELFVSISYNWRIKNEHVREQVAKLLTTIEELERKHIFIKITLVFPNNQPAKRDSWMFSTIPLFSHKEYKDVKKMSAVVNDRLLRKFYFAILENFYEEDLADGYGRPVELPTTLNIGNTFNEIEFFEEVMKFAGVEE